MYQIPGDHQNDVYLLPVSGGADSTALAILLHEMAPDIHFRMVFTDTGAEEAETLATLDKLEAYLGKTVERINGGKGLFDLIEGDYSGFLPSPRDRWCTRVLKLLPFRQWIAQFSGKHKWMFVGIRVDESERLAFAIDEVETEMPFVDLGINRAAVYRKLAETIGIPKSYATRSRSGCTVCPYQRASERIGLLQRDPKAFEQGIACEKLSGYDISRHQEGISLWQDTSMSANWASLPMPPSGAEIHKGRLALAKIPDLFGSRIWIGGEFFMDGMPGMEEFCWHQRVVCFSTTPHGARKQLDGRFQHLLSTAEVYGITPEDVRNQAKFALWYIEMPSNIFDPAGTEDAGSYTWHQGSSYRQVRHVVQWATRALHAEFERREAANKPHVLSVQYEWSENARHVLAEAKSPLGSLLLEEWYQPSEKLVEPETEEEILRMTPCPMCQI